MSPDLYEWLMGWPHGWAAVDGLSWRSSPSETASSNPDGPGTQKGPST